MKAETIYSSHWDKRRLGDVAEVNPKSEKGRLSEDIEVDFIPMRLVEEKTGRIAKPEIRKFHSVKQGYVSFTNNDILFAKVTPCMENGKIAIVHNLNTNIGFGSSEFHVIRVSEQILNSFLFYFLLRDKFRSEAAANMAGAVGLRRVPKQFLENCILPVPTIQEQEAIVTRIEELFSELDAGRRQLETVKDLLKTYRQTVLKSAFEGKLTNENVKEGQLPERWKWVKVVEVSESMKNGLYKPPKFYSNTGIACLRMYNISEGKIVWYDIKRMDLSKDEIKDYELLEGDLLINRVNSRELVGKSAYIENFHEPIVFESKNIRLRLKKEVNGKYLNYWFGLKANKYFNTNAQQTVGMASINQDQVSNFKFPKPGNRGEQDSIVQVIESRLSMCDKLEDTIETCLKQTEELKQSILKQAFEGKLVKTLTK